MINKFPSCVAFGYWYINIVWRAENEVYRRSASALLLWECPHYNSGARALQNQRNISPYFCSDTRFLSYIFSRCPRWRSWLSWRMVRLVSALAGWINAPHGGIKDWYGPWRAIHHPPPPPPQRPCARAAAPLTQLEPPPLPCCQPRRWVPRQMTVASGDVKNCKAGRGRGFHSFTSAAGFKFN